MRAAPRWRRGEPSPRRSLQSPGNHGRTHGGLAAGADAGAGAGAEKAVRGRPGAQAAARACRKQGAPASRRLAPGLRCGSVSARRTPRSRTKRPGRRRSATPRGTASGPPSQTPRQAPARPHSQVRRRRKPPRPPAARPGSPAPSIVLRQPRRLLRGEPRVPCALARANRKPTTKGSQKQNKLSTHGHSRTQSGRVRERDEWVKTIPFTYPSTSHSFHLYSPKEGSKLRRPFLVAGFPVLPSNMHPGRPKLPKTCLVGALPLFFQEKVRRAPRQLQT